MNIGIKPEYIMQKFAYIIHEYLIHHRTFVYFTR